MRFTPHGSQMPNLILIQLLCLRNLLKATKVTVWPYVASVSYLLKTLSSFLLPKSLMFFIKNWSLDLGHTHHSPKLPKFPREIAVEQSNKRYGTHFGLVSTIPLILGGDSCLAYESATSHLAPILLRTAVYIKGLTLEGSLDIHSGLSRWKVALLIYKR